MKYPQTNQNSEHVLRQLRKRAAREEDSEKLKLIAVEILGVVKKKRRFQPSHGWALAVRSLRSKLKLSQAQLGKQLDCSAMTVSRWERSLQTPPTRCLLEMGKMAGSLQGWVFWNMAGITIKEVRAMLPAE